MSRGRLLTLLNVVCFAASAQRYVDLHGRVLDTSEAGIGEASVTLVNEETGFRRITRSDPVGGYLVTPLQPGTYKVTVSKQGFRTVVCFGVSVGQGRSRADF